MVTRRNLLKSAAAAAPSIVLGGQALASAKATVPSAAAGKNLVVFITDQDRAIQHFPKGWEQRNLPGLSRLKRNGVSFENAFTNSCMCSPARATLLTGHYPEQHGVKYTLEDDMPDDEYPQVELPTDMKNIATVMSASGYDVVYKGKWHLSKPEGEAFAPSDVAKYGFDRWNPPDAGSDQSIPQEGGGVYDNDGRFMDSEGEPESGNEGVLQYLRTRKPGDKPFCLIISLVNPHDVLLYPKNYVQGGYDDSWLEGEIGLPPTVNEDLSTKPKAQERFLRLFNFTGRLNTPDMKKKYLNFYGNLMKKVDGYLVDVLETLDAQGLTNDTVVVRTSDHGEMGLAHGGLRQKNFNAYDETLRIPMVYSNPELFPKPRKEKALVSHVDFLPTLAGLFKAPRSARSDWAGKDYSKLVLGRSRKPVQNHVIFTWDDWQAGQKQGPYIPPPNHIVTIREKNFKLSRYYDADGKKRPEWELYDLKADPYERHNLLRDGHRPGRRIRRQVRRLKRKLHRAERERLQPLPRDALKVRSVVLRGDEVRSKVRAPGRGKLSQKVQMHDGGRKVTVGKTHKRVRRRGHAALEVDLSDRVARKRRSGPVELIVVTKFHPDGGSVQKVRRRIKARRTGRRAHRGRASVPA